MWLRQKRVVIFLCLCFQFTVGCVQPKLNRGKRIVGGEEIDVRNRNFQVSIQHAGQHFCGGSLILPDTVLSAAHCFTEGYGNTVRVGSNTSGSGGQVIQIKSALWHQNYTSKTMEFDICLVKLMANVTISSTVGLIRLSENENYSSGSDASVSGWGYQEEGGTISPTLRYALVPIISHATCSNELITPAKITTNMICAGYPEGGIDSCQGDSGGPLVQNNKLIGVVSFGTGCARKCCPGVYTNVATLIDWVVEHTDYVKSGSKSNNGSGSWPFFNNDGEKLDLLAILSNLSSNYTLSDILFGRP